MKILVIDDKADNCEAAKQTIVGHDLTVVDSWDTAVKLLEVRYDDEAIKAKLVAAGLPPTSDSLRPKHGGKWTEEETKAWNAWYEEYYKVKETCRIPYWDAVLSDLLMPASRETMGPDGQKFVGQEMPVGLAIALLAAQNGAKYVAVVTATNHHHHPAVAMLDRVRPDQDADQTQPNFVINGAKVMFAPRYRSHFVDGMPCLKCQGANPAMSDCYACNKTGKAAGKNWGKVLTQLVGEEVAKD